MGVDEVAVVDLEDGNTQCTNHPYKNNINPGGICAFCLQEKLGNLVSSSFPITVFPSSSTTTATSSDESDSFRSESIAANDKTTTTAPPANITNYYSTTSRRARIPSFLLTHHKRKIKNLKTSTSLPLPSPRSSLVYNRSKSTATHDADSPRRRGFWSFLYHSRHSDNNHKMDHNNHEISPAPRENVVVVEENDESPDLTPFDRKVSRSRSVGCGSRSFSGDFFERLSTGFGDCTLRRVESQREGKDSKSRTSGQDCIKERVKCGGIFSGFMLASSTSSNSYWVSSSSSSTESSNGNVRGKVGTGMGHHHHQQQQLAHGRSRSWGWAFASPMRAFGKPYSSTSSSSGLYPSIKRSEPTSSTPNLNATVPSLLSVRG